MIVIIICSLLHTQSKREKKNVDFETKHTKNTGKTKFEKKTFSF
jgi:hypothetical protein